MYVEDLVRQQEFLKKKLSLLTEQKRQLLVPTRASLSVRSSHQNYSSEIMLLQKEKLQTEQRLRQRSVEELARRVESVREQTRVTRACVKGLRESISLKSKPRQVHNKISQNQIFYYYQIVQKAEKKLETLRGREQAQKAHINLILRKIQACDLKIDKYRDRSLLAQSRFIRNILQENMQKDYQALSARIDRERRWIDDRKRHLSEKINSAEESQQRVQRICQRIEVLESQLKQSWEILQAYQRLLE